VADDYAPWRAAVRTLLEHLIAGATVLEACDGLEAVQAAEKQQPDVVILDISMPRLNGIEAAKQIRKLSPDSQIVFLSGITDEDIVNAALQTGATGYVLKRDMSKELVPIVKAALLSHS